MKIFIKQSYTKKIIAIIFSVMCVPLSSLTSFAGEIHEAAKKGDIENVKHFLKKANDKDENNRTPIYYAAVNGFHAISELLAENGADINCLDEISVENEIGYMVAIETYRHNEGKKQIVIAKIKNDLEKVEDVSSLSNDFRLYLLSIVFKLYNSQTFLSDAENLIQKLKIDLNDPSFYCSQYFSTLLYRSLHLPNDNAIVSSVIQREKDFLNFAFSNDNFEKFDVSSQIHTLRSLSKCINSGQSIISKEEREKTISKLNLIDVNNFKSRKSLFVRAKILNDKRAAMELLNMTVNELKEEGRLLNTAQGRGAIIALTRMLNNDQERLEKLDDVVKSLGGSNAAAQHEQGRKAMIQFAKIPGGQQKSVGITYLNSVISALGGPNVAAQHDQGRDAMIVLGKILGSTVGIKYLNYVIESLGGENNAKLQYQGREAIIALAKIPNNNDQRRIKMLESVISVMERNENLVQNEQGRDAMITFAKIPGDQQKSTGVTYLNLVIQEFGGIDKAVQTEQGRDAMMTFAKIPSNDNGQRMQSLECIINSYGGVDMAVRTEQGREAIITYAKNKHGGNDQERKSMLNSVIMILGGKNTAILNKQGREAMLTLVKIPPVGEQEVIQQREIVFLLYENVGNDGGKMLKEISKIAGRILNSDYSNSLSDEDYDYLCEIENYR